MTRLGLAAFNRLRTLTTSGRLCDDFSGPPAEALPRLPPLVRRPALSERRRDRDLRPLGRPLRRDGLAGLDTGCAWGRELTALRLDNGALFQEPAGEG